MYNEQIIISIVLSIRCLRVCSNMSNTSLFYKFQNIIMIWLDWLDSDFIPKNCKIFDFEKKFMALLFGIKNEPYTGILRLGKVFLKISLTRRKDFVNSVESFINFRDRLDEKLNKNTNYSLIQGRSEPLSSSHAVETTKFLHKTLNGLHFTWTRLYFLWNHSLFVWIRMADP